jgi:hypothetical protein
MMAGDYPVSHNFMKRLTTSSSGVSGSNPRDELLCAQWIFIPTVVGKTISDIIA